MPGPAVITIPHNLLHQTSAAFLADLVNTMSNTCPALRTLHCSPTHHVLTKYTPSHITHHISHHIHHESCCRKRDSPCWEHNTRQSQAVCLASQSKFTPETNVTSIKRLGQVHTVCSLCYPGLYKLTICWSSANIFEVHKCFRTLSSHSLWCS